MNEKIISLQKATSDVCKQIDKIINLEDSKRQSLLANDMDSTEACVKKQQALLMQLDVLEKKRVVAQNNAGFPNLTANEILNNLPSQDFTVLRPIFFELADKAERLQSLNSISLEIVTAQLNLINTAGASVVAPSSVGVYSANGKRNTTNFSSFEEKI